MAQDNLHLLAMVNRSALSAAAQSARRQQEHHARCCAVGFASLPAGSASQAARRLGLRRRTLSHWRQGASCQQRGRPCKQSPYADRYAVLEVMQAIGPHVGLPTLRGLFPEMPRSELLDLQRDYRNCHRRQRRLLIDRLTWHGAGQVWAMDHAEPPAAIDGAFPAIFAVRDLASGMQLAWSPVHDETAETMLPLLQALFDRHGAPLVLKSDNGSAFISESTRRLLAAQSVVHLLSPPALPAYNGSCEAGIGAMKLRTTIHAATTGAPNQWTADDLEAARRQAHEVHRSADCAPTAADRWRERTLIAPSQRQSFRHTIDRRRAAIIASTLRRTSCTSATEEATITRIAIRHALVEHGLLTLNRRSIPLPIKSNNLAKIP